jgi:hypothetical protein
MQLLPQLLQEPCRALALLVVVRQVEIARQSPAPLSGFAVARAMSPPC